MATDVSPASGVHSDSIAKGLLEDDSDVFGSPEVGSMESGL
jgi:hypothetical protein